MLGRRLLTVRRGGAVNDGLPEWRVPGCRGAGRSVVGRGHLSDVSQSGRRSPQPAERPKRPKRHVRGIHKRMGALAVVVPEGVRSLPVCWVLCWPRCSGRGGCVTLRTNNSVVLDTERLPGTGGVYPGVLPCRCASRTGVSRMGWLACGDAGVVARAGRVARSSFGRLARKPVNVGKKRLQAGEAGWRRPMDFRIQVAFALWHRQLEPPTRPSAVC